MYSSCSQDLQSYYNCIGDSSRPSLKQLQVVVSAVTPRWRELGLELLNENTCSKLEADNYGDVEKCCSEMFRCWLEMDTDANWKKILSALKQPSIGLDSVASMLEKKYIGGLMSTIYLSLLSHNAFLESAHFKGKSLPPSFAGQKKYGIKITV